MKYNYKDKDGEEIPIFPQEISNSKIHNNYLELLKRKLLTKERIIIIVLSLIIIVILFKSNSKYNSLIKSVEKLEQRIEFLESQISVIPENTYHRKIGVAVVVSSLFGNGIGRFISVLTELLAKTGKYTVYLIVEQVTSMDFSYYKDVIRIIQKKRWKRSDGMG